MRSNKSKMTSDQRNHTLAPRENNVDFGCSRGQKFMPNKREEYYKVQYEWEFSKFLSSSKAQLSGIHKSYPTDYAERDVSMQDKMWRSVLHLQEVMFGNGEQWSGFRRNKFLHDSHDNFVQFSTKRFVSRPIFEGCLLKAYRGHSNRSKSDEKLFSAMGLVYSSFDVHSKEAFDWRKFLYYFHFVLDPRKSAKDQMILAFAKIGNKACIDLQDLVLILSPLVKADATKDILYAFDEAWAQMKVSRQEVDENLSLTKLTMDMLGQMLELKSIKRFFRQSKSGWGRGRIFPVFISHWEQELYNTTLLQLVRVARREETISLKLERDNHKTKSQVWREWLDYAKYQCSLRSILKQINHRMQLRQKCRGMLAFLQWTARVNATLIIQRVGRGFLGRIVARNRWMIFTSARLIQTHFRMYLAKKTLNELSSRYYWAIFEVQRNIRGALGRRLAFNKLMTLVEHEHLRNVRERERLEMERGIWCLTKLQASWRRKVAIARSNQLRQKRQREIQIQQAMETERNMFLRERQIYERQLEGYYRAMREEHADCIRIQSKVSRDQTDIRTLRRRLKNEELKNVEPDNSEYLATEKWKMDWEAKIESGVESMKSHCIHCLDQPDNKSEKHTRSSIKKRVKGRVKEVLTRATERGIPMETKEAKEVAREEIIHIIGEEERAKLQSQMDEAFAERERCKEEARLKAEAEKRDAHARASLHAASVVATACRKWLARKQLREFCLETYEKIFDELNHAFFYRNKISGDVSWAKPKAMGDFEIPAKDEWKILRDAHDFPYYFNPYSMEMRWKPPPDEDQCCGVVPHTWWREYPVRHGQCPNFSCILNEDDGKRYCEECIALT